MTATPETPWYEGMPDDQIDGILNLPDPVYHTSLADWAELHPGGPLRRRFRGTRRTVEDTNPNFPGCVSHPWNPRHRRVGVAGNRRKQRRRP